MDHRIDRGPGDVAYPAVFARLAGMLFLGKALLPRGEKGIRFERIGRFRYGGFGRRTRQLFFGLFLEHHLFGVEFGRLSSGLISVASIARSGFF